MTGPCHKSVLIEGWTDVCNILMGAPWTMSTPRADGKQGLSLLKREQQSWSTAAICVTSSGRLPIMVSVWVRETGSRVLHQGIRVLGVRV